MMNASDVEVGEFRIFRECEVEILIFGEVVKARGTNRFYGGGVI